MSAKKITRSATALLWIVNGALWIHWLRTLEKEPDQTKKCSEVQPHLRLFLHILAWFGLVSAIAGGTWMLYYIFKLIPKNLLPMIVAPCILCIALAVALFTTQIMYIRTVASSERRVAENCTEIEAVKHAALLIVSALIIAMGLFSLFNALLTDETQTLTGKQVAEVGQLRKKLAKVIRATRGKKS